MLRDDDSRTRSPHSRGLAVTAAFSSHTLAVFVAIWLASLPRPITSNESTKNRSPQNLIWLATPGPGGGGGGGGNRTPVAAPAQQPARDRLTVSPPRTDPKPVEKRIEPPPIEPVTVPAKPMAAGLETLPGTIQPLSSTQTTQGPGILGGAGSGTGSGSGEGQGSGLGPGVGGGTGGGAYRPGSGVTGPQLVAEVKPNYTVEAMRAKIQGIVVLECVVLPDGTIGDVRIVKSIDKVFGLDEEAVKTAKRWRFRPGLRLGEPVPVFVTIELSFTLR
jgi:protein TonB